MTDAFDDKEALAAEYVLGTLPDAVQRQVESGLDNDPELAEHVALWADRLAPLSRAVPPVAPSPQVWRRIEAAIAPPETFTAPERRIRPSLLARTSFWRWWAGGATALAGALAAVLLLLPGVSPDTDQRFVATLSAEATPPSWLATADPAAGALTIQPVTSIEAEINQRDLELWLIDGSGAPPRSLGLLDPTAATTVALSTDVAQQLSGAAVLAISLEPAGGSPTGAPTGPVLFQGGLHSLTN